MTNEKIYYCNVGKYGWSTHKQYEVKTRKNWNYIVVNGKQIGVSTLEPKIRIRDFDDVVFNYVFNWHDTFDCPAIGYFVYRKVKKSKITINDYKNKFKIMTRTNNVLNIPKYLEQTNNDNRKNPKFQTLEKPKEVERLFCNKTEFINNKLF